MNKKKLFPLILTIVIGFCSVGAVVLAQQATEQALVEQGVEGVEQDVIEKETVVQATHGVEQDVTQESLQKEEDVEQKVNEGIISAKSIFYVKDSKFEQRDIANPTNTKEISDIFPNVRLKKSFLSPDQNYFAVTVGVNESTVLTYITDTEGEMVASPKTGSFSSWAPDSSRVLVYVSDLENEAGTGMRIYYLELSGKYYDTKLPEGVWAATQSPVDTSIAYSLTDRRTNSSKLYVRNPNGTDSLLFDADDNMLAWISWSPDGKTVAFAKSDLYISQEQQKVMIAHPDNGKVEEVAPMRWGYPLAWKADGTKFAFANKQDIWEYSVSEKTLHNVTNFKKGMSRSPSYSADGQSLVLVSDSSGESQVWLLEGEDLRQVTHDSGIKKYPSIK